MASTQKIEYAGGEPIHLTEGEVADLARVNTHTLPVGFFVGVAKRESGWKPNEIDTDYKDGVENPQRTYGLLMLRLSEATAALQLSALIDPETLLDPATNLAAGANVFAEYYVELKARAPEASESDLLKYVCWAHNQGIGAVRKSVSSFGLDWAALKARPQNAYMTGRMIPYAEEVARYVDAYPEVGEASALPFVGEVAGLGVVVALGVGLLVWWAMKGGRR